MPRTPALLASMGLLLSACSTNWPTTPSRAPMQAPPAPPRGVALLSALGDESGLRVIGVEGRRATAPAQGSGGPVDAPAAVSAQMGYWLSPGRHVIRLEYVRNIEPGVSLSKVDLPITLQAGRTYIVRPTVGSDFGRASFAVVDHGAAFPVRCLPWSIKQAKTPDARGDRPPYTRSDIDRCRQRAVS